jgi:hypothetical protein
MSALYGWAGKIVRVDLGEGKIAEMETEPCSERFVGEIRDNSPFIGKNDLAESFPPFNPPLECFPQFFHIIYVSIFL